MPCTYNQIINCQNGECAKCGWNPEVSRKRAEIIKYSQSCNATAAKKFRQFQALYSLGCVKVLEARLEGKINACSLAQFAAGNHPNLTASQWSTLEQAIDQLLSEMDQGDEVSSNG